MSEAAEAATADDQQPEAVLEKDPKYPLAVEYCPVCTLPHEYCEHGPSWARCLADHPQLHQPPVDPATATADAPAPAVTAVVDEGAQKRGGKGVARPQRPLEEPAAPGQQQPQAAPAQAQPTTVGKKKKGAAEACVTMTLTQRSKRKHVTTVSGLQLFGVKLADATKLFTKRFACGASVVTSASGVDEIDIQGDVREDLVDFIAEKFNIPPTAAYFVDGKERRRARP